jgi:predicted transcriptional regulator
MGDNVLRGLELEVMRFISENEPISVRDAAEQFGEAKGLARTTILTVMERLRKKGYLKRSLVDGIFVYSPAVAQEKLMRGIVEDFVEKTLGGSLAPFVAYLSDSRGISADELADLKALVKDLEEEK